MASLFLKLFQRAHSRPRPPAKPRAENGFPPAEAAQIARRRARPGQTCARSPLPGESWTIVMAAAAPTKKGPAVSGEALSIPGGERTYSMIEATMPAPTVRPPSRIAKRSFSSMAIGTISSTATVTLSPGMTISVPSGSETMPVTSVVRK